MSEQLTPTAEEQKLNNPWNENVRAEFDAHRAKETIATMLAKLLVNLVPARIDGNKKEEEHETYSNVSCH
jgi:hypothetical protein